jgi:hypothetical protein
MKEKQLKKLLYIMALLCALCVTVMTVALCMPKEESAVFTPPPFEADAVSGVPTVDESLGYSEIYRQGMGFSALVCGNVTADGLDAKVYFTNPAENTVWLKLRIMDAEGNILGETGILKPGEYVECVTLAEELGEGTKISLKIMAYEAETYHSEGAVILNTAIRK